ncbi:MAG: S1C family serine protease [Acidobacteriota bacterium]
MKHVTLAVILFVSLISMDFRPTVVIAQQPNQQAVALTNADVVNLVKAGISAEVITAKIQASSTAFDTSPSALQELKAANIPDSVLLVMLNPKESSPNNSASSTPQKRRITDELTGRFKELEKTVVTVWSEIGHGTGFIFDQRGLVMTNQHVIGPSELISVQFDPKTKVPAKLLAASPEKDIAVLWIDLTGFPSAAVAVIAKASDAEATLVEGERVMTIGSPLSQRKIMTTGVASKIEERAIISDININPGNSGGPLFNSLGEVVGLTTFGESAKAGPGISGIVRIEEAIPVIEFAVGKMALTEKPEARLLPVEPDGDYPLAAVKEIVDAKKFDFDPYLFGMGEYEVSIFTPLMKYRLETEAERKAQKTKNKRNNSKDAVQGTFDATEQFRNWAEYAGQYRPILQIRAQPKLGESFWGSVGRAVAANYGIHTQANLRFKTDFYRMKLFCGQHEVEPIQPSKLFFLTNERNYFVKSNDATYVGFYSYPADAINEKCGTVRLQIFSEKHPDKAETKVIDKKAIGRVIADFQPYFKTKQ